MLSKVSPEIVIIANNVIRQTPLHLVNRDVFLVLPPVLNSDIGIMVKRYDSVGTPHKAPHERISLVI